MVDRILVIVPRAVRFLRRFDLHEVHVVHHAAVFAYPPVRVKIVDGDLAHLGHHRLRLVSTGCFNRSQIVSNGGINGGMRHGRHAPAQLEEPFRPSPALVVAVPVKGSDKGEPLHSLKPNAVDVSDKGEQRHDGFARTCQSEFVGLLGGVDHVSAGICQCDDFGPNRKALKSALSSGWRALPNTFPPLATTALVADPSNSTPITFRLHAQSFKRSLAGCRPTSPGTGSGLAPEGGLSCRLGVKMRNTRKEQIISASPYERTSSSTKRHVGKVPTREWP